MVQILLVNAQTMQSFRLFPRSHSYKCNNIQNQKIATMQLIWQEIFLLKIWARTLCEPQQVITLRNYSFQHCTKFQINSQWIKDRSLMHYHKQIVRVINYTVLVSTQFLRARIMSHISVHRCCSNFSQNEKQQHHPFFRLYLGRRYTH